MTNLNFKHLFFVAVMLVFVICQPDVTGQQCSPTQCAADNFRYLRAVMDQFHGNRFYVYYDIDSPHNNFLVRTTFVSNSADVSVLSDELITEIQNGMLSDPIHEGATAIRFELDYTNSADFGGLIMQNGFFPNGGSLGANPGNVADAGVNLTGALNLKFWARGEKGGETIDFFMGGEGRDPMTDAPRVPCVSGIDPLPCSQPGSTPRVHLQPQPVTLTTTWTEYSIPLSGVDLSFVIGGFGWSAAGTGDPDLNLSGSDNKLVFFVDNIYFELDAPTTVQRQQHARLLRSFTTRPIQSDPVTGDFDHRFRNVCFVYDNALALLAFIAEGTPDGLARAKLIGDALVYAATHDRTFTDGRLRSAYRAGDLTAPPGWEPNGIVGEVRLPGFFNPATQTFQEVAADNVTVGNTAWAMVSLLALYQKTVDNRYLDAARDLGEIIRLFRDNDCQFGGFTGGEKNIENSTPTTETFSSAEHNIDVFAAFTVMYQITGEQQWKDDADHAKMYVFSMWDPTLKCFYSGSSIGSTCAINMGTLPLDVQPWAVLGIPETIQTFPDVLRCAENQHQVTGGCNGFFGFDFDDDRDGVWFEGTGQMVTAYAIAEPANPNLEFFRNELCRAQTNSLSPMLRAELPAPFDQNIGIPAACRDGVSTGFGSEIHQRLHIAATSWSVFGQSRMNPYYLVPGIATVPTVSEWGLLVLALIMLVIGIVGISQRRKESTHIGSRNQ